MLQLPSSPPDYSFNPPPGTTVAELQQHLLKSVYIATTTTDLLEGDHGRLVLITQMMMAQTLGEHPVFKRGSAQDILEATQILAVLDNLEARLRSPHKGATTTSSSSRGAAAGSSSAAASSSNSSSSSSTPEPLDDPNPANHLAVNALTYASTIAAGLLKAHCRSPEDTAPLTREPFNGLRKALLPRLRQFLFTPHPQVVQAALQTAAVLTGMPMLPGFTQFELMIIFDRHPTRWVLARFLDSGVAVVTPQLCGLQDSLQEALKGVSNRGPEHTAITVDFDFPAISYNEVAVCDACGRHNYFPVLVRWAWKEPCQLKACSGCRQRRYWSAECQKVHWKAHKQRCKAMQAQRAAQKEK